MFANRFEDGKVQGVGIRRVGVDLQFVFGLVF